MTDKEYKLQVEKLLKPVPSNFHDPLIGFAWDYGHSVGLHEVVHILQELIEGVIIPSLQAQKSKEGEMYELIEELANSWDGTMNDCIDAEQAYGMVWRLTALADKARCLLAKIEGDEQ